MTSKTITLIAAASVLALGCTAETAGSRSEQLEPRCFDPDTPLPADAWVCPDERVVECDGGDGTGSIDSIWVGADVVDIDGPEEPLCGDVHLGVDDPGPYPVGTHDVRIRLEDPAGVEPPVAICETELTVVDTLPPDAVALEPAPMWPPNHSMHRVTVDDCVDVTDGCDPDVEVFFLSATSDEPADARGDGHHAPDIRPDGCDAVMLRAERQGGGDGRVYTLRWRAIDDAGHSIDGTCRVTVPHDQSGRPATDSGEAHAIRFGCDV